MSSETVTEPSPPPSGPPGGAAGGSAAAPGPWSRAITSIMTGGSITVTVLAIVLALAVSALLIAFSDPAVLSTWSYFFAAPTAALSATWDSVWHAYLALFEGSIVSPSALATAFHGGAVAVVFNPLSETVVAATPLIMAGLSVSIAFRAGLFNIGAQGQIVFGAIFAGYVGFAWSLPPVVHVVVAVAAGILGGALYGLIPGLLKARTGAHEVITTIMLNYVATNFLLWLLGTKTFQRPGRSDPISRLVDGSARLPHLAGPDLRVHAGIILALMAVAGTAWILRRSTLGFEMRAVGSNPQAAGTAGMSVSKAFVVAMLLAGALSGLAGANQVLGTQYALTPGLSGNTGFEAITVALLGRTNPWGVVLAGLLFGALQAGGVQMQAATQVPVDVVTVIQSLIVVFIAAPPLVRTIFRLRGSHRGGEGQTLARGW